MPFTITDSKTNGDLRLRAVWMSEAASHVFGWGYPSRKATVMDNGILVKSATYPCPNGNETEWNGSKVIVQSCSFKNINIHGPRRNVTRAIRPMIRTEIKVRLQLKLCQCSRVSDGMNVWLPSGFICRSDRGEKGPHLRSPLCGSFPGVGRGCCSVHMTFTGFCYVSGSVTRAVIWKWDTVSC